jgi:hypothetical protein
MMHAQIKRPTLITGSQILSTLPVRKKASAIACRKVSISSLIERNNH